MAALAGIPLAMVWFVAERLGIMEGRQLVAMSFVELLFFIVLGPRLWWQLAGPSLYLYFLVPFGAFLTRPLRTSPRLRRPRTVVPGYTGLYHWLPIENSGRHLPDRRSLRRTALPDCRVVFAVSTRYMYRGWLRRAVFIALPCRARHCHGFRALGIISLGHLLGSAQAVEADHILYGPDLLLDCHPDPDRSACRSARRALKVRHLAPAACAGLEPIPSGDVRHCRLGPTRRNQSRGRRNAQSNGHAGHDIHDILAATNVCPPSGADATRSEGLMRRAVPLCSASLREGVLTLTLEVFSPRSPTSQLLAEQHRLTDMGVAEDVQSTPLNLPNAPQGAWHMIAAVEATHVAAASLWIEGEPARLGLMGRVQQAWRSIVGSQWAPGTLSWSRHSAIRACPRSPGSNEQRMKSRHS